MLSQNGGIVCEVNWTHLLDHVCKGFPAYNIRGARDVPFVYIKHALLTRGDETQIDFTLLVENSLTCEEMTVASKSTLLRLRMIIRIPETNIRSEVDSLVTNTVFWDSIPTNLGTRVAGKEMIPPRLKKSPQEAKAIA